MERTDLKTQRLLLRPFQFGDVEDVLAYASDSEWGRFLLTFVAPPVYTREHAETFVAQALLDPWEVHPRFAIQLEQHVIGGVDLSVQAEHKIAGLGYAIGRSYWGQGLTPEAARAVMDWGFLTFGLVKIFARADARNRQSTRVMEKLGMTREGLLRKQRYLRGEHVDEVWYGLVREDWEQGRKAG